MSDMQDPFFQFTPESHLDFKTLTDPVGENTSNDVAPDGSKTSGEAAPSTINPEVAQAYEEAKDAIEEGKEVTPGTLAERIKAVEQQYNESMNVPIYGKQLQKRLLTLASTLNNKGYCRQAAMICKTLEQA